MKIKFELKQNIIRYSQVDDCCKRCGIVFNSHESLVNHGKICDYEEEEV